MDENRIRILFERVRNGNYSQQDIQELNEWYHNLNAGGQNLKKWFAEAGGEEMLADRLYDSFGERLEKDNRKFNFSKLIKAAAILTVLVGIGLAIYLSQQKSQQMVAKKSIIPINPAQKTARLTLDDGSMVNVKDLAQGTTKLAGAMLEKTADGSLIYKINGLQYGKEVRYNTITTPRAGQFEVILPDGTHVWLNAASSLKFPLKFQGTERVVTLQGEGYFEVARNAKMPFKVLSGIQTVTVLGTHFNIKAYQGEQNISTTLFEGSVNVKNNKTAEYTLLKPGHQADLNVNNSGITVSNADLDQALSWKNGYFIFENQDVKAIMTLISRWYDVDVEYHITSAERFGGTFSRSTDLKELLKNLESLGKTRFQLKERKVIVSN